VENRGIPVSFGVVYGSYAKGTAREESDIDLLVVSRRYDRPYTWTDVVLLWEVAADTDSRIEPIPCGEEEWIADDSSAVIEIARREGRIIKVA
jgi:predicted nucleotidyltransferase